MPILPVVAAVPTTDAQDMTNLPERVEGRQAEVIEAHGVEQHQALALTNDRHAATETHEADVDQLEHLGISVTGHDHAEHPAR
ncbi:MAG: hypothetical protein AB1Z98_09855 [Nannocystaceae bacterium]